MVATRVEGFCGGSTFSADLRITAASLQMVAAASRRRSHRAGPPMRSQSRDGSAACCACLALPRGGRQRANLRVQLHQTQSKAAMNRRSPKNMALPGFLCGNLRRMVRSAATWCILYPLVGNLGRALSPAEGSKRCPCLSGSGGNLVDSLTEVLIDHSPTLRIRSQRRRESDTCADLAA
jgi:hypothetical protein